MNKTKIILVLAVWVTILPYLGFPYSLKNILFSVTGLILIYLAYLLFRDFKAGETEEKTFDNFSENSNFKENEVEPQEHNG